MVNPLSKCTCCISLVLFRRESGQSHGCKKNRINPSRGWTTPYAMSSKDVKYIKVVDTLNFAVALQLRFDCRRVNPYQRILEYQFRLELSTVMPIICLGLRLSIGRDYRHQVFFRFALSARPQPQLTTSTRTQDRRHRRWPVAQYPQSPTSRACAYALALSWQPCVPKNIKYASCLTSNPERFTSNFQAPT